MTGTRNPGTIYSDATPEAVEIWPLAKQGERLASYLAEQYFDLVVFETTVKYQGATWARKDGEPLVWSAAIVTEFSDTLDLFGGAPVLTIPEIGNSTRLELMSRLNKLNRQCAYLNWVVFEERRPMVIEANFRLLLNAEKELDPADRQRYRSPSGGLRLEFSFNDITLARVASMIISTYEQALWGKEQLTDEFPDLDTYPPLDLENIIENHSYWKPTPS